MNTRRVVIDYGHGGSKPGAVYGGVEEKTVNLFTGQELYHELHKHDEGQDIQVMLTRDSDYDIPISVRCQLINQHHERQPIGLVISVHYNAVGDPSVSGFEVYYLASSVKGLAAAREVLRVVQQAGIPVRGQGLITTAQLGRRLAMIHKTKPPAILIEVGYLTNVLDRNNAQDPSFRTNVARAVAKGIRAYLEKEG
ncbi:MAG: N-acetylmuramoyl-L-alanine amidase [Gemmatimonadota bacterium]|nr:MAG: N-acetylmuramoyl-L-alanine amidase [Gemmatimonadota bacterium]